MEEFRKLASWSLRGNVASGNDWSVPHTAGNRDVNPRSVTGLKLLILELFPKY